MTIGLNPPPSAPLPHAQAVPAILANHTSTALGDITIQLHTDPTAAPSPETEGTVVNLHHDSPNARPINNATLIRPCSSCQTTNIISWIAIAGLAATVVVALYTNLGKSWENYLNGAFSSAHNNAASTIDSSSTGIDSSFTGINSSSTGIG